MKLKSMKVIFTSLSAWDPLKGQLGYVSFYWSYEPGKPLKMSDMVNLSLYRVIQNLLPPWENFYKNRALS